MSKRNAGILGAIFCAIIVASVFLQVLWADWVVRTLFDKDYNNWAILLAMFIFEMCTPKILRGLSTLILFICTFYIWVIL
jgi:hypothetical protein